MTKYKKGAGDVVQWYGLRMWVCSLLLGKVGWKETGRENKIS